MTREQWLQAIEMRHSVRSYQEKPIETETLETLRKEAERCSEKSGLRIQLVTEEPEAFRGFLAHYGKFSGVRNYIALVAPEMAQREELAGYYGERLVLLAQALGLNTCWVALTYRKRKCPAEIRPGEKLLCVISLGYGATSGAVRKSKTPEKVSNLAENDPMWFRAGVQAALQAPTAVNQQQFFLTRMGEKVTLRNLGGPCSKLDYGIVKLHFELGAGTENFYWEE